VEALAAAGLGYAAMCDLGVEMPVVSMRIDYRRALCHGDRVILESECADPKGVRWPWRSRLLRDGQLVAEAAVELVMLRQGRVLRAVPDQLVDVMKQLRQGPSVSP